MSTQTDPNAAYNANVREIARMIAKDVLKDQWDRMSHESNEYRIKSKMDIARAMVAEMAKTFEQAYFLNLLHDPSDPVFNVWHEQCDRIMQERGLIPNPKTDYCTCTEERTLVCDDEEEDCMCFNCGKQYIGPKTKEDGE